jgi:hypothetical protein
MKMHALHILCWLLLIPRASAEWSLSTGGTLSLSPTAGAAFDAEDFARVVLALQEQGKLAAITHLGAGPLLREDSFHDELLEVMQRRKPKETAALLKSSGNMHNPAVTAFYRDFGDLLLETPTFIKMFAALRKVSRVIGQPEFEKLRFEKDERGRRRFACMLWVPVLGDELPANTPQLFRQREFDAAMLAEAVNHFLKLGPVPGEKALKDLAAIASIRQTDGLSLTERAAWICRVLYQPAARAPLRDIRSGGLSLPYLSMPLAKWPLYPLARSGDSLFVLAEGRHGTGIPESLTKYIAWCRSQGVWLDKPLPVPDRATAMRDAENLRAGAAWQAIRWKDRKQGNSYTMHEAATWSWIAAQAERIPVPADAGEKP